MSERVTITVTLDADIAGELMRVAAKRGVSAEEWASDELTDCVMYADGFPPLEISDEEFRASIEEQRRQIADGTMVFSSHEEVMARIHARLAEIKSKREG